MIITKQNITAAIIRKRLQRVDLFLQLISCPESKIIYKNFLVKNEKKDQNPKKKLLVLFVWIRSIVNYMHKDSILLTDEKLTEKFYKVSKTSDCNLRMD